MHSPDKAASSTSMMAEDKEEEDLSKDFSDLLSRASTLERRRAERRSRVKNTVNDLGKSSPRNGLGDEGKKASVRNLAKRFEASSIPDARKVSSQRTETTASSITTATTTKALAEDKTKSRIGHSTPSPQPSAKVLMAHAAFAGTPPILEKLPPKRTSVAPTITDKLPPTRISMVASRAALFTPGNKSSDVKSSPTAAAPLPSHKMKLTQPSFSGTPTITEILPEKRQPVTPRPKPPDTDTAEPSQFFKLAQAAFSEFTGVSVTPQSLPPKQPSKSAGKVAASPVPSPKVKLAHDVFSSTPAVTEKLPPKRTSAPVAPNASTNHGGYFAAWNNVNVSTEASNNTAPPSIGFGKPPLLAIPAAAPRRAQPSAQPVPNARAEYSFLHLPEKQIEYKHKTEILKAPSISTTEKLRMYLTSVQEPPQEKNNTGLDAELENINVPFSDAENKSNQAPAPQPPSTNHVEVADESQQDSASDTSDSSLTFSVMITKSIDNVVWNYSGNYSDNPRNSPPPAVPAVDKPDSAKPPSPTFSDGITNSIDKVVWNYSESSSENPRDSPPAVPEVDEPKSTKRSDFMDVDMSKDGVDEFDFVEDDDDLFHDEYRVITYAQEREKRRRLMTWLSACIGVVVVALSSVFGLGLHETSDDGDRFKVPSLPWTGDCFDSKLELRMAIDRYLQDKSPTSDLAAKYGWPINSWCVSELDDFSYLFRAKVGDDGNLGGSPMRLSSFNEDISAWNVSKGRLFNEMFVGANFDQDLSNWNVGNAINMERMFDDSSFTGDLSAWDVKNVKNTKFMFRNARNFNSDLSKWQIAPDNMEGMFMNAEAFSSDLSGFNVLNVRDFANVFSGASSFNGDISNWKMESAERLDNLFKNAELFNGDLSKWLVKPTSMDSTFYGTSSFTGGARGLLNWDTSKVNDMSGLFAYSKFQGDISSWNLGSVTSTKEMFLECRSFDGDVSKWDVKHVKDFSSMFEGAEAFSGDLSTWDVSSGNKLDRMFARTNSFNTDLSLWNITSVRTMTEMFANATSYSRDLCSWGVQLNQTFAKPDDLDTSRWSLFVGTRCPEENAVPDFSASPPGPFCHPCRE